MRGDRCARGLRSAAAALRRAVADRAEEKVITALWFVPLVILAVWFDRPQPWFTVLAPSGAAGVNEVYRMTGVSGRGRCLFGLAGTLFFFISPILTTPWPRRCCCGGGGALPGLLLVLPKKEGPLRRWAWLRRACSTSGACSPAGGAEDRRGEGWVTWRCWALRLLGGLLHREGLRGHKMPAHQP
jgi:hypothetical protein